LLATTVDVGGVESIPSEDTSQDQLYEQAAATYGAALERLARAYEADAEKRRDLLQEIHLQVWRSLGYFNRQCSLRTWVYRVAHHAATSHVVRERRVYRTLVRVEDLDATQTADSHELAADTQAALERLSGLIRKLKPLDRQIMVSYLEGLDAVSIGEITGLSAGNVAMKIHRIKTLLARRFWQGGSHAK
jgi:RNA polymerase sigma-70 factor, ECF subfamily